MKYSEVVSAYLVAIGSRAEDAGPVGSLDCNLFADEVSHKTGMEKTMIHLALDGIGVFSDVALSHITETTGMSLDGEPAVEQVEETPPQEPEDFSPQGSLDAVDTPPVDEVSDTPVEEPPAQEETASEGQPGQEEAVEEEKSEEKAPE